MRFFKFIDMKIADYQAFHQFLLLCCGEVNSNIPSIFNNLTILYHQL